MLEDGVVLLLVYVDVVLLSGENDEKVLSVVEQLNERFETVDLKGARFLLGMGIKLDRTAGTVLLMEQGVYNKAVLDKSGLADARSTTSPSEAGPRAVLEDEVLSAEDITCFASATGLLLYFSRRTIPDMTHAVMVLKRSMAKSDPRAMLKLKRVLRYLKGTASIDTRYSEDAEDGNVMTAFVDSDFALTQTKATLRRESCCTLGRWRWNGRRPSRRWWRSRRSDQSSRLCRA